jgi:Asp-tRNA(Asn)/Glu-tRNA(Gln) amidotransferase C subunit
MSEDTRTLTFDEEERQVMIQALDILLGVFDDYGTLDASQQDQQFRAQMLLDTLREDGDPLDHQPITLVLTCPDCGKTGEQAGHQDCQFPENHS